MNFEDRIKRKSLKSVYNKKDLLTNDYLLASENEIAIYYAPFDFINKDADIIIIGITPGWSQMEQSFRTIITELHNGSSYENALKEVKSVSSFAGSMRSNLINMLNELGLQRKLNLDSASELFSINQKVAHTTSALKYPVFYAGKNYTGSKPSPLNTPILWRQIKNYLVPELSHFTNRLIIPLGKSVDEILTKLKSNNQLNKNYILNGFPHPSGANGHRLKTFEKNKLQMIETIKKWNK